MAVLGGGGVSYERGTPVGGVDPRSKTAVLDSSVVPSGAGGQRFRGGLVSKAHRLLYHSTLGLRVIKMTKKSGGAGELADRQVQGYLAHKKLPPPRSLQ